MTLAYAYPDAGVPFVMAVALVALTAAGVWAAGDERPWESPYVRVVVVFGTAAVVFMAWAAATGY